MPEAVSPPRTSPFFWDAEVRPGLRVAFTSSTAGNLALHVGDDPDAVGAHRRRLEAAMGIRCATLRFMSQTHSDRVVVLGEWDDVPDAVPEADGMISPAGREALAVLVADCVPIVLADSPESRGGTGATAVVHAGRAGVVNGILGNAVAMLRERGAAALTAWIGPSVCGSCYEVPRDMMEDVARTAPAAVSRTRTGTPALDLPAAVRAHLLDAGVSLGPIGGGTLCTLENPGLFSHRRDPGVGRIAGLVWRT